MGVKERSSRGLLIESVYVASKKLTFASSFEFSIFRAFRSPSSFSVFVLSACTSSLAIFNCSSVRWTFNSGVTRTRRRHQGQSRTCINARTFLWMHRTANSWEKVRRQKLIRHSKHADDCDKSNVCLPVHVAVQLASLPNSHDRMPAVVWCDLITAHHVSLPAD